MLFQKDENLPTELEADIANAVANAIKSPIASFSDRNALLEVIFQIPIITFRILSIRSLCCISNDSAIIRLYQEDSVYLMSTI
jgi:hypothetical protein